MPAAELEAALIAETPALAIIPDVRMRTSLPDLREEAQARPGDRRMSPVSLIPSLQSDALVREIEQQLTDENSAIAGGAQRDARSILAQARAAARGQVHEAIAKLREEGARRIDACEGAARNRSARARAAAGGASGARCLAAAARGARSSAGASRKAASNGPARWRGFVPTACRTAPGGSSIRAIGVRPSENSFVAAVGNGAQATFSRRRY